MWEVSDANTHVVQESIVVGLNNLQETTLNSTMFFWELVLVVGETLRQSAKESTSVMR